MDTLSESLPPQERPDFHAEEIPGLRLDVLIEDPEVVALLVAYPEGRDRNRVVRTALRIGVMALKQAQGQIDAAVVRQEGDRLLQEMASRFSEHVRATDTLLSGTLRDYFDPANGRFNERVDRLIRGGGELESLLQAQVSQAERSLTEALIPHLGVDSPLLRSLATDDANGFLAALRERMESALTRQADTLLREFSLDNAEGALARLVRELKDRQGEASAEFKHNLKNIVDEFSLDNEHSALSRLVQRVEQAQQQISGQFSLDNEASALARLRREMLTVLESQNRQALEFQSRVVSELSGLQTRRAAEAASTTHGHVFQDAGFDMLQRLATPAGDVAEDTGSSAGVIPRCKVGDALIILGADSAAAGARIAVEFKEDASYTLKATLEEIDVARKNREAGVGLFVHSRRTAPTGLESLARHGSDVVVVWDAEDEASDAYLKAGFLVAKALAVREHVGQSAQAANFKALDASLVEIQRQARYFDDLRTWGGTIKSSAEKIIDRVDRMQRALDKELDTLATEVTRLQQNP